MEAYENSLKYYRDLKNVIDTANNEGREEGRKEGMEEGREEGIKEGIEQGKLNKSIEIVKNAITKGLSDDLIAELTGLPIEQIQQIRENKLAN